MCASPVTVKSGDQNQFYPSPYRICRYLHRGGHGLAQSQSSLAPRAFLFLERKDVHFHTRSPLRFLAPCVARHSAKHIQLCSRPHDARIRGALRL